MNNKKDNKSEKANTKRKCASCGLDCSVLRIIAVADVPDSQKKDKIISLFGESKPAFTPNTCKKR